MKIIFANSAISGVESDRGYFNALSMNRATQYLQSFYYERKAPSGARIVEKLSEAARAKSKTE